METATKEDTLGSLFDSFAVAKNVRLTQSQKVVADLLIKKAESDSSIRDFLSNRATGKSFLFNELDDFFSQKQGG